MSILDGFGSGSPQPTFEEQVAAFQQVQEAISNLQELTELMQVDQSLRTVLDREADNLRDRAQFAMNTFHTQILDIADSRMSTANETLRRPWRVSSDARDRLIQEAFGNTQRQASAGFSRHSTGSLEPEDQACRRFLWGLPVTYQLVFVSMQLGLELNPGQDPGFKI